MGRSTGICLLDACIATHEAGLRLGGEGLLVGNNGARAARLQMGLRALLVQLQRALVAHAGHQKPIRRQAIPCRLDHPSSGLIRIVFADSDSHQPNRRRQEGELPLGDDRFAQRRPAWLAAIGELGEFFVLRKKGTVTVEDHGAVYLPALDQLVKTAGYGDQEMP